MVNRHLPYKHHHQTARSGQEGDYLHNAKALHGRGRESAGCVEFFAWSVTLVSISMVSYLHSIYFECLFVCMKHRQTERSTGRGREHSLVLSPAAVSLFGVTINANVLENCNEL